LAAQNTCVLSHPPSAPSPSSGSTAFNYHSTMFRIAQDNALPRTAPGRLPPLVAKKAPVRTEFTYMGSAEQGGWGNGLPLLVKWLPHPERLDPRSNYKFFESGREYTMGRSPNCDIFFKNTEADPGISALHLKIKVPKHFSALC
jgi:hypothetical protein